MKIIEYNAEPTAEKFHADNSYIRGIMGPWGCVSGDTEFLTPTGWKKIKYWKKEDLVAEFNPQNEYIEFRHPEKYIKQPAKSFYFFEDKHIDMCLSDEHTMLFKNDNNQFFTDITRYMVWRHNRFKTGYQGFLPAAFKPDKSAKGIPFTDDEFRLIVAVSITYHYILRRLNHYDITKPQAIEHINKLRAAANCSSIENYKIRITGKTPISIRFLSWHWPDYNQKQLWIIADEIAWWRNQMPHRSKTTVGTSFYTSNKQEADFIQYAAICSGHVADMKVIKKRKTADVYCIMWDMKKYRKVFSMENVYIGHRKYNGNAIKYCFKTKTGFFVARRNNKVFITGNSGKSTAMCMEILRRCIEQKPFNGIRKSRWAIVRNTFPQLKSTTIKTWSEWMPRQYCRIVEGSPIMGYLSATLPDKTKLDAEIVFMPLDDEKDIDKLLSLELTGAWINEARETPFIVIQNLPGRTGRYPSKNDGGCSWSGMIMDTNPPDTDSWWYKYAEEDIWKKDIPQKIIEEYPWKFFKQPGALMFDKNGNYIPNPEAENIKNLNEGYDYYFKQIAGKSKEWIKVYILGQYGISIEGRPVWTEYNDDVHCAKETLKPLQGSTLIIGMDFGLDQCACFCQYTPIGQFIVIDELISDGIGTRQFANEVLKPYIVNNFPKLTVRIVGDPAGAQKAQSDEKTCFDELRRAGFIASPASTNIFESRRSAVAGFLLQMISGRPGFLISPKCINLRKALIGHYKYEKLRVLKDGEIILKDEPVKNKFSHIAEALQYAALFCSPDFAEVKLTRKEILPVSKWKFR